MDNESSQCECGMDLAYCLDKCPKRRKPNLYRLLHVISDKVLVHVGDLEDNDDVDVDTLRCTFETDIVVCTPEYNEFIGLFEKYRENKNARTREDLLRYLSGHWIEKGEAGFDSMLRRQCEYYAERKLHDWNGKEG